MSRTLVVSISGIRGVVGRGLDPEVVSRYAGAYAGWCHDRAGGKTPVIVVGRDARVSGALYAELVMNTLQAAGCDVIDAGLATTPTVEMAVIREGATGGIVLSASHNPAEWNALKLLGPSGEFLSPAEAADVIERAAGPWADYDTLGQRRSASYLEYHVQAVVNLPEIDVESIRKRDFRIVVDGINSVGAIAIPAMLEALGVRKEQIILVNGEPHGRFAHPAEPLPQNLVETCAVVKREGADLGLVVDPDADRLALIQDGGVYVSEELTQVLATDFWWGHHDGPFVTNLSSSRAIEDVARQRGQQVFRSAVGEINVVEEMKRTGAVIGGEGNGGVILSALHNGRDALVGAAFILQHLVNQGRALSSLVADLPAYHMAKLKTDIAGHDPDVLLARMAQRYAGSDGAGRVSTVDGVKVDLDEGWVHMRRSNTEPIIRVYAEAGSPEAAHALGERFMAELLDD